MSVHEQYNGERTTKWHDDNNISTLQSSEYNINPLHKPAQPSTGVFAILNEIWKI